MKSTTVSIARRLAIALFLATALLPSSCLEPDAPLPDFIPGGASFLMVAKNPAAFLDGFRAAISRDGLDREMLGVTFDQWLREEGEEMGRVIAEIAPGKALVLAVYPESQFDDGETVAAYVPVRSGDESARVIAEAIGVDDGYWRVQDGYMRFWSGWEPAVRGKAADLSFVDAYPRSAVCFSMNAKALGSDADVMSELGFEVERVRFAILFDSDGAYFDSGILLSDTPDSVALRAAFEKGGDARELIPSMDADALFSAAYDMGSLMKLPMLQKLYEEYGIADQSLEAAQADPTGAFSLGLSLAEGFSFDDIPEYGGYVDPQAREAYVAELAEFLDQGLSPWIALQDRAERFSGYERFAESAIAMPEFSLLDYRSVSELDEGSGIRTTRLVRDDWSGETGEFDLALAAIFSILPEHAIEKNGWTYVGYGALERVKRFLDSGKASSPVSELPLARKALEIWQSKLGQAWYFNLSPIAPLFADLDLGIDASKARALGYLGARGEELSFGFAVDVSLLASSLELVDELFSLNGPKSPLDAIPALAKLRLFLAPAFARD
jgi:hypothetical protein